MLRPMAMETDRGFDPGAPLTFDEAAALAHVDVSEIEALARSGALLTERQGKGDVDVVRWIDLGDLYPDVIRQPTRSGQPVPIEDLPPVRESTGEASPAGGTGPEDLPNGGAAERGAGSTAFLSSGPDEGEHGEAATTEPAEPEAPVLSATPTTAPFGAEMGTAVGGDDRPLEASDAASMDRADLIRASAPRREALIELCQDLETRLDLAERERQASTASLLMAQRRVLELELAYRRRPWYTVGSNLLGALALSVAAIALISALRTPSVVRASIADGVAPLREELRDARAGLRQGSAAASGSSTGSTAGAGEALEVQGTWFEALRDAAPGD